MPVQPAITVCAPITQLWATWIWLSSLTPSSITVSSSAPRSMVVLAPISTSSPMRTAPTCGILIQRPASRAMPKPSAPITAPECTMHARADRAAVVDRDARIAASCPRRSRTFAPDHAVRSDAHALADARARPDHREGVDLRARIDVGAAVDLRERMDAGPHGSPPDGRAPRCARSRRTGCRRRCAASCPHRGRRGPRSRRRRAWWRAWSGTCGLARKAMSPGPAESSVATPVSGAPTSPTASPPRFATISRSVRLGGQDTSASSCGLSPSLTCRRAP